MFNNNIEEVIRIEPVNTASAVTDEKNNMIVIDDIEDFVCNYGLPEHDYFDIKRKHGYVCVGNIFHFIMNTLIHSFDIENFQYQS